MSKLCIDVRKEGTNVRIRLTQPSPDTLKCGGRVYTIDPDHRAAFKLKHCVSVNPQPDALYTMYTIADGSCCDETWHDLAPKTPKK